MGSREGLVPTANHRPSPPKPAPRVRDLAKRFEPSHPSAKPAPPTVPKRIGRFRVNEHGQMFRMNSQPVRVGVVRKKSSLKKRSQSSHENSTPRREPPLRKSVSSNLAPSHSCLSEQSNEERRVPPHPVPSPRPRGNKPDPPAKPARLISPQPPQVDHKRGPDTTSKSFPFQSKEVSITLSVPPKHSTLPRPRCPPPAPPKPPSRERINRIPSHLSPATKPSLRMRRKSSSEDDTYQKLPTPPADDRITSNSEKRTEEMAIPRIPTIAPPQTPNGEYSDDSQCYEEIGMEDHVKMREVIHTTPSTSSASCSGESNYKAVSCSGESNYKPSSSNCGSDYNYVTNIYLDENADKCSHSPVCGCPSCQSRRRRSQGTRDDAMTMSSTDHTSSHFATMSRAKKPRRPTSTLELDKLFRFKSELQLNLSKKMDQLRQKVGERRPRTTKFSIGADELETDGQSATREQGSERDPDDDRYIYGDDWSSDEEANEFDDRRSSMYKELEEQLNKTFPATMSTESEYESADVVCSTLTSERPEGLDLNLMSLQQNRPSLDEPSPDYDYSRQYTSRLPIDPPLYQIYMLEEQGKLVEDVILRESTEPEETPEKETKIKSRRDSSASSDSGRGADCSTSASALTSNTSMRRERLVAGSHFGSQRSLWCELAEVKSAGLLETLDDDTKQLQEAFFEVITSEASYLRSLNILITHFMASQEMLGSKSSSSVITNADRKHLFSNIFAVRDCSERLLCDLESRLEENLVLDDISDILVQHFENNFDVYVKYCSNQVYQDRTLRRLKSENPGFLSAVSILESDRQCQGLDMRSFLMLPMQRITRYPLLMYAIIDRIHSESEKYKTASVALIASNKVVRECNEGARRMERTEQLLEVDRRLVYKDNDLKRIPLVSNSRHLVKRGTLTQLVERRTKGLLQSRQKARSVHVFLFSDMIMITKKKINGTYVCKDYATRPYVDIEPLEPDNHRIPPGAISSLATRPHLFLCVLMRNARGKQTELLLSAESETDRERWLSAIRPPTSLNPEEKVYAEWDCPQAVAVHPYSKGQEDELDLQIGDVTNILRKMPDGWFYGERCRDGVGGWFPSSYVQPILNDHVRANNYRHRLRIIQAASESPRGNVGRGTTPFMDRLRRMSNPRNYFCQGNVNA